MEFEHKWSPEPWEWGDNDGDDAMTIWDLNGKPLICPCLMADAQDMEIVAGIKKYAKLAMVTPNPFDGPRITRCVNACAGIPNPEGLGELVKAVEGAFGSDQARGQLFTERLERVTAALRGCGI